ncbi:hypothetical protein P2R64_23760 [Priestia megaterium]|uniref:hypothetical protein n=1 Tax=Priestia megaterium TaxID=1404 RepID=UPI0021C13016|nr:hypothetical protein [Priestia megaterium]MCT9852318.1 hypothetical protein [Priestia megaterium]MDF1963072.1 hypothetical protein [Priestia megaterium]
MTKNELESIFWSIGLPGLPQVLNGRLTKGILFIGLEIVINIQSTFNQVILLSFQGETEKAIEQTNYQWLMFYPCLYFFSMWDAYKDANEEKPPLSFLPFVFSAYFVTVGIMYSSIFSIKNVLLGPVWLPLFFLPIGLSSGLIVRKILIYKRIK